ncbi:DUF1479-domain-containing protein [Auriscalpium vulgare]|uniref:DUF1479-domain-containing protein n=1 Tax=Auriscalpium vulgare TaxID=40419 RepID=A0ACB8RLQ3_9AGAM|nr:DUF1479-domain-containing protein [Auriscalpium vulgare]
MADQLNPRMPARFVDLKRTIAAAYPDFEARITRAWAEILDELDVASKTIAAEGPNIIPQVQFADLASLSGEQIDNIKRRGCVVIRDVVDDEEVAGWKSSLDEFVKANPDVPGLPDDDKQFFHLYWTKAQVLARAHPNVLNATTFLNNLYHTKDGKAPDGVDLSAPLSYADRFRIRRPGVAWEVHPPHIDGGAIERWEDETFRQCFADILSGDWRKHDAYDLEDRINARSSLYGRPGQATVFRTYQGWLALSPTGPRQGTIQFFPDVLLSNAYLILRPFFSYRAPSAPTPASALEASNWTYDISTPDFPGIFAVNGGFAGRLTVKDHPHLRLDTTMTSVPDVGAGDMVFWHCDLVHSVETVHTGAHDSAVMYIPAVPTTPQNAAYIARQNAAFVAGVTPPDFGSMRPESVYVGTGTPGDVHGALGRRAMGFEVEVA